MDNNQEPTKPHPPTDIIPPPESRVSVILNGASNGMMIMGGPFASYHLYQRIRHGVDPSNKGLWSLAIGTVTGCVIGAVIGIKEANRMYAFHQQLADGVNAAQHQAAQSTAAVGQWTHKHEAEKAASHHHAPVVG